LATVEIDDIESSDAVESEFLRQQVSDVDGRFVQGLTGLYNHGNTCYANAAIQALSNWYVLSCHHFGAVYVSLPPKLRGGGIK